jgi:hypothetical protein
MEFYFKALTVEAKSGGKIVSRRARTAVYPILEWFGDLGVYYDLILSGSDVNWLSEMNVSIGD